MATHNNRGRASRKPSASLVLVVLVAKAKAPPFNNPRRPSRRLTPQDAAIIKQRINGGEFQNRIAADFDVNPGRISEIKTGKRFAHVSPAS